MCPFGSGKSKTNAGSCCNCCSCCMAQAAFLWSWQALIYLNADLTNGCLCKLNGSLMWWATLRHLGFGCVCHAEWKQKPVDTCCYQIVDEKHSNNKNVAFSKPHLNATQCTVRHCTSRCLTIERKANKTKDLRPELAGKFKSPRLKYKCKLSGICACAWLNFSFCGQ